MTQIRIPPVLRPEAAGNRTVDVEAATVREALDELVATYPALRSRVLEGDGVPSFLNVFVDGDDVRLLGGLDTAIKAGSTILLLPAVAGG
jgi:sulfur-carrier protein